jgi:hypothetical protein
MALPSNSIHDHEPLIMLLCSCTNNKACSCVAFLSFRDKTEYHFIKIKNQLGPLTKKDECTQSIKK